MRTQPENFGGEEDLPVQRQSKVSPPPVKFYSQYLEAQKECQLIILVHIIIIVVVNHYVALAQTATVHLLMMAAAATSPCAWVQGSNAQRQHLASLQGVWVLLLCMAW